MTDGTALTAIHIKQSHSLSVTFAEDSAKRDLREIDYALGQEATADAYAYSQSVWHLIKAGYTGSLEPLAEGSHYFESAASTIPIIAPLIKERIEARKTHTRISYLQDAISRDPNTPFYEAEAWEVKILNHQDHDYEAPYPENDQSFVAGLYQDWRHTNSIKGYTAVGRAFSYAVADFLSLPFRETFVDASKEHYDFQLVRLIEAQDTLKPGIHFNVDKATGNITFSPDTIDSAIDNYEARYKSRAWRLVWSSAATVGAANFIQNEVVKSSHYAEETYHSVETSVSNFLSTERHDDVEPISSTLLSGALIFAHIIPASLTFAPLKKAANKVSEHCGRMIALRRDLELLKFARNHGEHDPELSRFTPG